MVKETNSNEHCNVPSTSETLYSPLGYIQRKTEIALVAWEMLAMKMAT
uniref:Uncharacterized protein n=1 Tax=Arabidopsis thaliana TaxID=3702 RepID=Q67XM0_ARATH|nr:unnamed protein product [Arabidopsis thaliana]